LIAHGLLEIFAVGGFTLALLLGIIFSKILKAPYWYLGVFFLALSFLLFEEYLWLSKQIIEFPHLAELFQASAFLIPPVLYFYTIYHVDQKPPGNVWPHFIPALISFVNFFPLYFQNKAFKACYIHEEIFDEISSNCSQFYDENQAVIFFEDSLDVLLIGQFIFYAVKVIPNWKFIADRKTKKTSAIFERWGQLIAILFVLGIVLIFLDVYFFTQSKSTFATLYLSAIVFCLSYFIINQSILLEDNLQSKVYDNKTTDEIDVIFDKFHEELHQEHNYTNQNLTVSDISKTLGIPSNELSYILSSKQTNFRSLLNNIRIEKAIEILNTQDLNHLSIEGIGKQLGYKSKTTFYKYFKEKTGKTPKEFMEQAKK